MSSTVAGATTATAHNEPREEVDPNEGLEAPMLRSIKECRLLIDVDHDTYN